MTATAAPAAAVPRPAAVGGGAGPAGRALPAGAVAAADPDRDDAEIRALLRTRPMAGSIRVALTREPDARIAAAVEGERHAAFVARDGAGRLLGYGSRSVRRVYLGGAEVRLGYLGQLRAAGRGWGLGRLRAGYAHLRTQRRSDELPFDLTAILADNEPARRLLERGLPGLPLYRPLTEIETLIVPAARGARWAGAPAARPLAPGEAPRLLAFLEGELRARPFGTVWRAEDLAPGGQARGLGWGDFRVVEEGGAIAGAAALWDQRAYKQAVVAGYAGWLGTLRPLVNLGLLAAGRPLLPPPGSALPMAFVAGLAAGGDPDATCGLLTALRVEARRRGLSQLVASFAAGDPLGAAVRRRFGARRYRSLLYTVTWPGDPPPPNLLAGGPPCVEAALL